MSRRDAARTERDAARAIAVQKAELLARFERVWAKSAGRVPSRNEMDTARAEAARSREEQTAAQARLRASELELAARRKEMGGTVVRAPFSGILRSEEHTSELQSLMRISYAVFCLKKKKKSN